MKLRPLLSLLSLKLAYIDSFITCTLLLNSTSLGQENIELGKADQPAKTASSVESPFESGLFRWTVEPHFLEIEEQRLPHSPLHPWIAVKDPSVVHFDNSWHLFCTLRKLKQGDGRIRIGYISFDNWKDARSQDWAVLQLTLNYHGAPQIFYFEPHKLWYLIYQASDNSRSIKYEPCYSTNTDIRNPQGWTLPLPLYEVPEGAKAGLDFWVVCDDKKSHLFFTTLNGQMWRSETTLDKFPDQVWSKPKVVLEADIFEASHTYKLKGRSKYFTIVEAQGNGRRYFKGFAADRLEGPWFPLAATAERPLVSPVNVLNQQQSWATSYSHGEFLRSGYDQKLEVDPNDLHLLFQGVNDAEYHSGNYGQIPWRLGILNLQLEP